ncbi:MAG: lysostaphin resistance A-like protein [Candidatus Odinarchaeota archaeon]
MHASEQDAKESFLNHPATVSVIVVLLFYIFLLGSTLIADITGGVILAVTGSDYASLGLFELLAGQVLVTAIIFAGTSVLFFLVIPRLGYPEKVESLSDYLDTIRLSRVAPLKSYVFIGLVITATIMVTASVFTLVAGFWNYGDALKQILPPDSWSAITGVIPGFFEEVAFRGVIATGIAAKYGKQKAILGSAFIFGIAHVVNVFFGADPVITTAQVGYALFLGILFAYVFFETDSLVPVIIVHYFTAAVGQFFVYNIFQSQVAPLMKIIYMVTGLGIVPMALGLGVMKILGKIFYNYNRNTGQMG